MKPVKQIITENLIELRKTNKITQLELAEKLNYSDKAISRWEHGDTLPDIDVLCQIADMYGVTFDYLIHEGSVQEKRQFLSKTERNNKLTITLLAVSLVWFFATIIYVYANLIFDTNFWKIFLWAVPASIIIALIFNGIWGKKKYAFYLISILIWTSLASVYVQFLNYNIWLIFLLGIPMQLVTTLWSTIR